ncbi:MAG: formylmethanofuran dehydrogenase subunit A [Rhodocyclaceae bacterium]|nr:formylmethanofuran dehydrogenase subunit A [Rhodocyclaceae bacterium]
MKTLRLRGGRVVDPANPGSGTIRDIGVRDGRIVDLHPDAPADEVIDCGGCLVMAGGIDLHTHIGGGKVNLARLLLPELQRDCCTPDAAQAWPEALDPAAHVVPGTLLTGYRYAQMGYTSAFEPAMVPANARHAHMEMGDVPILDHGAYVMLGSDELLLRWMAEGKPFEQIRDYIGWTLNATKALGLKVVNPGGISAFKFNQRKLDVDEHHSHWRVTPRDILHTLARGLTELGVPHPLHIHGSNLGIPGNIESTLATIDALEGLRAHLTHIQFHSYGTEGPKKFSSAALQLVEAVNRHPNISIDVGQIMFGQTVTASGDTMRQLANAHHASPRKWVGADIECDAGCGVVPFRYKEQSYVNALQWAIGLEIFLLVKDPWRVVLTTDHPNGGPFTSYPHLIRLLMDRDFRNEQLARIHPDVAANSALKDITRELTLDEIAIMTRAGPARLLGLADRGHLAAGAAADIAVYREAGDPESMFTTPEHVFKDGVRVAYKGRITASPVGGTHFVEPAFDRGIEKHLKAHHDVHGSVRFEHLAISHDELCECSRCGGTHVVACEPGGAV